MRIGSLNNLEAARRYLTELSLSQDRLEPWRLIDQRLYDPTPASISTILVTDDALSIWSRAIPIRYTIAGTTYYGAVSNITAGDRLIGVYGPALTGDIEALWVGHPERTLTKEITIIGDYGALTGDIGWTMGYSMRWMGPPAYLVGASLRHTTNATTTQPTMNLFVYDGSTTYEVAYADVTMGTAVQYIFRVVPASYRIEARNTYGFYGKTAGVGATQAANLNGTLIFVLE